MGQVWDSAVNRRRDLRRRIGAMQFVYLSCGYNRYMWDRYALSTIFVLSLMLGGCNGCLIRGERELTKDQVVAIGNETLQQAGYDLTKIGPERIRASYLPDSCLWGVTYVLYTDRLPAGPLVVVDDRTHVATIEPGM
jgi:hypothetical protein